jgi:hypothetical protein
MEEKSIVLREKLNATIQALRGDPQLRIMRGKALLDSGDKRITFVENEPRGPRSVEIGRTGHSRYVRRPDGHYTITFRVDARTKYLTETLVAEVREVCKSIAEDRMQEEKRMRNQATATDDEEEKTCER